MFVNGVHGDLDGLVISIRFSHVAAAGPTALHEVLLTGLAEAQAHHVIRAFLNRFALGLGALLDLLEHVVGEREGLRGDTWFLRDLSTLPVAAALARRVCRSPRID